MPTKNSKTRRELTVQNPDAAGLDIGAREILACVPPDRTEANVHAFGTFTPDLQALADWLRKCKVRTVAMESTGVYWIPIFELLEAQGAEVYLVNARHIKNVPGRKSDVKDCQWIQQLHSYGLLQASFRPAADMCALRAYLRHRAGLIDHRAAHNQHMQKALQQMNVQLKQVLSDVTGVTGMDIIRAIVAGERDPVTLAQFRQPGCRSSEEKIAKALTGHYQPEHVFALKQALALYDFYTAQIEECDAEVARQYAAIRPTFPGSDDRPPLPPNPKPRSRSKNDPGEEVRQELYRLTGVDLTAIDGLGASTAQTIMSEIGTDMSRWRTVKHFCSWLGLAPHNDITGGKVIRSRTLKNQNRAAQALRIAAQAVGKSDTALGAFYRRMKARHGPAKAITATAHKLARIIYHMLKEREPYHPIDLDDYEQSHRERQIRALKRKASRLGFQMTPQPA